MARSATCATMVHWLAKRRRTIVLVCISPLILLFVCAAIGADAPPAPDRSVDPLSPRDLHVWGRFTPGTWKQVKIVTETLNDRGAVVDTTTTDTKTTLLRADAHNLALKIEATVDVAGKRFQNQPQVVEYGYFGEPASQPSEQKDLGHGQVTIEGQQLPCQVKQVVANLGSQKQMTKIYLCGDVEPYILKRETTVLPAGGRPGREQETRAEVIALNMHYGVLNEVKPVAWEQTVQKTPHGTNITLDVTCMDVPGGIVARTTKELDEKGRLIRRSAFELIDYRVVVDDDDNDAGANRLMTRREIRRARRGR